MHERAYLAGNATDELLVYGLLVGGVVGMITGFDFAGSDWLTLAACVGLIVAVLLNGARGAVWVVDPAGLHRFDMGRQGVDVEQDVERVPRAVIFEWYLEPLLARTALEFDTGAAWEMPWRFAIGARRQADLARAFSDALGVPFHDRVNRRS
jgi:nucleotide-binding universal stress UspA family protein